MTDDSNKSEKATPYKLREAKKKGQVSRSVELTSFLMMALGIAVVAITGGLMWHSLKLYMQKTLQAAGSLNLESHNLMRLFFDTVVGALSAFAPLICALVLGAVVFNLIQTGPVLSSHPLKPDWNRLNPVKGFKKLWAKKTLFDFIKTLLKIAVIYALWLVFGDYWLAQILAAYGMPPAAFLQHWSALAIDVFLLVLAVLLPLTLVDVLFNKWDFAKQMMMSKQDVKDEHKKREGDPQVKQKQKQIQQELLRKAAALQNVKDADVVITNPTHLAIALKYTPKEMLAPKILAMGEDNNAAMLRAIARTHNVPIVRNVTLARALYKNSVIDGYIPHQCYDAVALVFRQLMAKNNRAAPGQEGASC